MAKTLAEKNLYAGSAALLPIATSQKAVKRFEFRRMARYTTPQGGK